MFADRASALALSFAVVLGIAAGAHEARAQATPDYAALLAAPDRSDADREADKRRDPLPLLKFAGPAPGMKVLDMGAGGGYSTELMARAVAPNGKVVRSISGGRTAEGHRCLQCAAEDAGHEQRGRRLPAVRRSDSAGRAHSRSDHVPVLLPRHDLHERRSRADGPQDVRSASNPAAIWCSPIIRPRPAPTSRSARSLHRIDEAIVRKELEAAGFKFVADRRFLARARRHPRLLQPAAAVAGRYFRAEVSEADVTSFRSRLRGVSDGVGDRQWSAR